MKHIWFVVYFVVFSSVLVGSVWAVRSADKDPALTHTLNVALGNSDDAQRSLLWIAKRGLPDLAPHLINALRYTRLNAAEINMTLQAITGETTAKDWFHWMLWQQRHGDLVPHHSFLAYKSTVFQSIDKNFARFINPNINFDIRIEDIVWGGVHVDGIPALDSPKFIKADDADYLLDDDEVFGVEINGDARAYPLRIMGWHEMFNDVIGGVPVSLAYCTLCGAAILYEGEHEGRIALGIKEPFTFGSSGLLYQSNKLMYDRQSESLWNQFTGEPVSGALRGSGLTLKIRPVVITSWGKWKAQHHDTKVLSPKTGFNRDYGSGVVYKDYFASQDLMFPALGDQQGRLDNKTQIFGLRLTGGIKAWPLEAFGGGRILNDRVGAINVVLIGEADTRTVRAYERGAYEFDAGLKSQDGQIWTVREDTLINKVGDITLKRLPGHVAYWFAWAGYMGEKSVLFETAGIP